MDNVERGNVAMNTMYLTTSCHGGDSSGAGAPAFASATAPAWTLRNCLVLVAAFLFAAVAASPAQAMLIEAAQSPVGSAGTGELQFSAPAGIAVNRTTDDVYVADTGNNRIQRLSSDGTFISTFGWGVQDGSNALQTCTSGCQAGSAGNGDGELSSPSGIAIDPGTGDVFVADQGNVRIVHFTADGTYVGAFGSGLLTQLGAGSSLAFGPSGSLFVLDGFFFSQRIARFDAAGNAQPDLPASGFVLATSLDVDTDGHVFIVDNLPVAPGPTVTEFDSSGRRVRTFDSSPTCCGPPEAMSFPTSVTVNPADNHVFVSDSGFGLGYRVLEYDDAVEVNAGMAAGRVGSATGAAYSPTVNLGTDPGVLYIADNTNNRIVALTPLVAAPTVARTRPTSVHGRTAELKADINPNHRATRYSFEYGTTTSYGSSAPASPGGDLGQSGSFRSVRTLLTDLTPSTTYHFRAVATNSEGTTRGPDRTLTTDRLGGEIRLPENRAYEQVSPVDKGNTDLSYSEVSGGDLIGRGAPDGSAIAYMLVGAYPESEAGGRLSAVGSFKTDTGWMTRGLDAPAAADIVVALTTVAVSRDLSHSLVTSRIVLAPGAIPEKNNVYVRDNRTGDYQLVVADENSIGSGFVGGSSSFDHLFFASTTAWTSDALPGVNNLYEWSAGRLKLASKLPDGSPTGILLPYRRADRTSGQPQVSADGRRVYFEAVSDTATYYGVAYLREDEKTVPVSVSQRVADPGAPAVAVISAISEDGSKAYFATGQPLTEDAHANRTELYEFDADTGKLRALSADFDLAGPGDDQTARAPAAVDASASTVYYSVSGASGSKLLVLRNGTTRVVKSYADGGAPGAASGSQTSRNGRYLTFSAAEDAAGSATQIHLYDADTEQLVCASCRRTGEASEHGAVGSSSVSGWSTLAPFASRILSDRGQVFFETEDPLVPEDTNGKRDVYEWSNGAVYLLSGGQSAQGSYLLDSSESGDDVFIVTRARLVGQDRDDVSDVYDVRVDGGIASQNPSAPPAPCGGSACQGDAQPPASLPTPASVSFAGPKTAMRPSGGSAGKAKVKLASKTVKGTAFAVQVTTPSKGRIRASGTGLLTVSKSTAKAGTYKLTVRLTPKAKQTLRRKRQLKVTVRVSFTPRGATASATSVSVTLKA